MCTARCSVSNSYSNRGFNNARNQRYRGNYNRQFTNNIDYSTNHIADEYDEQNTNDNVYNVEKFDYDYDYSDVFQNTGVPQNAGVHQNGGGR